MSRLKLAGALAAGFVVCALLIPTGALSAAPSLVGITDNSGTRVASVDKAHQLLAAESDPANAVLIRTDGIGADGCSSLYTVPKGRALVLKTGTFLGSSPSGSGGATIFVQGGPTCSGPIWAVNWFYTGGTASQNFGSQLVIPQGAELDLYTSGFSANEAVDLYGYLIPAGAAPAGTRVISRGLVGSKPSAHN